MQRAPSGALFFWVSISLSQYRMNTDNQDRSLDVDVATDRAGAWSRYWATGARHSCAGSFSGHYGQATAQFWKDQFLQIRESDHLLELGCGNGSLLRFLAETDLPALPAEISAVDQAQLDQSWLNGLPTSLIQRLQVCPGTSAESLPLADGVVNRFYSQYALEYFAADAVWTEIDRVLAPAATISLICHHAHSLLATVAQSEAQHCEWLLSADGVLEKASLLLPVFFDLAVHGAAHLNQDEQALRRRSEFNNVLLALEERARAFDHGDVLHDVAQQVMRILKMASQAGSQQHTLAAMEQLRNAVQDSRLRASELVACALNEEDIQVWTDQLKKLRLQDIQVAEIHEQSHLFGWTITASR